MKTLYEEIKAAGIAIDHHESDLYFRDCVEARAIIARHPKIKPHTFRSTFDKQLWWDAPGMYDPYWQRLVSAAAEAQEIFDLDELERFAAEQQNQ